MPFIPHRINCSLGHCIAKVDSYLAMSSCVCRADLAESMKEHSLNGKDSIVIINHVLKILEEREHEYL